MSTDPSHRDVEEEGRVIAFRPQSGPGRLARRPVSKNSVEDLASYERPQDEDDYGHRMRVNLAALAIIIVLVAGGVWIAEVMAQMRKDQNCILSGRRNCNPITLPTPNP